MEYDDYDIEDRNEDREEEREREEERYEEYDYYTESDLLKRRELLELNKQYSLTFDESYYELDRRISYIDKLLEKYKQARDYKETSPVDNDDGETVTITNRDKDTSVSFKKIRFSDEIIEDFFDDLHEVPTFLGIREDNFELAFKEQHEIERRLSELRGNSRRVAEEEIERVKIINKKIKKLYRGRELGNDEISREIVDRTKIDEKTGAVYFKRTNRDGTLANPILILRKKNRLSDDLIYSRNERREYKLAREQFKALVKQLPYGDKTVDEVGEPSGWYDGEVEEPDHYEVGEPSSRYEEEETDNYTLIDTEVELDDIEYLSTEENREVRGALNPSDNILIESRIGENGALQIEVNYLEELIGETIVKLDNAENEEEFDEIKNRIGALREARRRILEQRRLEEARYEQEQDISRYEKFKKWAKENMVGLSAVAISIGGIVTSILVSGRGAIVKTSQGLGKFAKAVYDFGKKLGGLLAPLLGLLAQVLSMGASGIAWLASNLWVLVLFAVWFIYDNLSKRKR